MNAWKYEIISRVEQDIWLFGICSLLVNTRNKFHISAHPCIILRYHQYTKPNVKPPSWKLANDPAGHWNANELHP